MTPRDPESWLWALGRRGRDHTAPTIDDGTLRAFRDGTLDDATQRQVAAHLSHSPTARARLRALADAADSPPPADLRDAVLAAFDASSSEPHTVRRGSRSRGLWLRAAAILLVAASAWWIWHRTAPRPLPSDLGYRVAVHGLTAKRAAGVPASTPGGDVVVDAEPATLLRIEATPSHGAIEDVRIGIYLLESGRLRRVDSLEGAERDGSRGAVTFRATAAELLGTRPDTYTVVVIVARPGRLPPDGTAVDDSPGVVGSLTKGGERLVYLRRIRLIEPDPAIEEEP